MKRLLLGLFALLPVLAGAQEAKEGDAAEAKEESYAGKIVEMRIGRSEGRRGGKECRSRWSPDH